MTKFDAGSTPLLLTFKLVSTAVWDNKKDPIFNPILSASDLESAMMTYLLLYKNIQLQNLKH